ncbi:MAG: hypothetical protein IKC20_00160 [Clostridia bacterium]|nr:hypothetical protein [Clostridia bacterium]
MKCPNCNGEIGRFELAPECKHCGANIFYCQQEKLLTDDAKKCELEFASFRILKEKLKAAFIGGPIQILRIVAMVAAIGIIFIPFVTLNASLPLFGAKFSLGAWGVYEAFSGGELIALLNLREYIPEVFAATLALCVLFVMVFLMGLGVFGTLLLSFINIRKSAKAACGFSVAGMVFSLAGAVMSFVMPKIAEGTFIQAKPFIGAFFCIAIFAFIFALNLLVIRKNIAPDIKEVDLKRVELRKRIKAGEITLDELPLPVFETEEEKAKRLEEEAESKTLADKARGGEHNG